MATNRRRLIREKVLQILYAHEISKDPLFFIQDQQFGEMKENPVEYEFAKSLIRSVADHIDELDKLITDKVSHWEFQRIAAIDKILLRMAISELLYFPDIPPKVTINEAIEIAKHFSTDKSGDFVNGILDAILVNLREQGKLKKAGRGLIDVSLNQPAQTVHTDQPARAASAPKPAGSTRQKRTEKHTSTDSGKHADKPAPVRTKLRRSRP